MNPEQESAINLLKQNVLRGAPEMDHAQASDLALNLFNNDFKLAEDLRLVQFEDLRGMNVSIGMSRKLISYWEQATASASQQRRPRGSQSSYEIPWNHIGLSKGDLQSLKNGDVLSEPKLNEVIRLVVEDIKTVVPNATRSIIPAIANDMAAKYLNAFKDLVVRGKDKENLSTAAKLSYKMQNRFDNTKRKPNRSQLEIEAPPRKEAFGCIKWQVLSLPEGETLESLNEKKEEMKTEFSTTGRRNWDWRGKLRELLTLTYAIQRRDINSQIKQNKRRANDQVPSLETPMTTHDIRDEWPFLFVYEGAVHHFEILTGRNFKSELKDWLSEIETEFIDFMATLNVEHQRLRSQSKRAIRHKTGSDQGLACIVQMLLLQFKEESELIMQLVPMPTTLEQVNNLIKNHATPLIIGEGKSWFHVTKVYLSVDGLVRGTASTFARGLGLLFCCYYMLNIQYPARASKTLDFIQRCIVGINPTKGSKAPGNARNKKQIAFKVLQLNSKFEAYRQTVNEEEDVDGELEEEDNE